MNEGYFQDYGDVWYNFAKRNKFLSLNEDLIREAKSFGMKRALDDAHEGILLKMQYKKQMTEKERESKQRSYARSYVVSEWMKTITNPKSFAQSITLQMLE